MVGQGRGWSHSALSECSGRELPGPAPGWARLSECETVPPVGPVPQLGGWGCGTKVERGARMSVGESWSEWREAHWLAGRVLLAAAAVSVVDVVVAAAVVGPAGRGNHGSAPCPAENPAAQCSHPENHPEICHTAWGSATGTAAAAGSPAPAVAAAAVGFAVVVGFVVVVEFAVVEFVVAVEFAVVVEFAVAEFAVAAVVEFVVVVESAVAVEFAVVVVAFVVVAFVVVVVAVVVAAAWPMCSLPAAAGCSSPWPAVVSLPAPAGPPRLGGRWEAGAAGVPAPHTASPQPQGCCLASPAPVPLWAPTGTAESPAGAESLQALGRSHWGQCPASVLCSGALSW